MRELLGSAHNEQYYCHIWHRAIPIRSSGSDFLSVEALLPSRFAGIHRETNQTDDCVDLHQRLQSHSEWAAGVYEGAPRYEDLVIGDGALEDSELFSANGPINAPE